MHRERAGLAINHSVGPVAPHAKADVKLERHGNCAGAGSKYWCQVLLRIKQQLATKGRSVWT